jgi:hypothetical protein
MTKARFRQSSRGGWEWSDNGTDWYLTFRSRDEIAEMHGDGAIDPTPEDREDREREAFGETLGDEIPDDLWAMIAS